MSNLVWRVQLERHLEDVSLTIYNAEVPAIIDESIVLEGMQKSVV